jgi:hypothetical protein
MGGSSPRVRQPGSSRSADVSHRLEVFPTCELHARLQADLASRELDYERQLRESNASLHQRKITFGGARDMVTGLTALLLEPHDVAALDATAQMTYRLVEKTLDWLAESPERIAQRFPHLERIVPHLFTTRGWSGKQVVSRYDAVVTPAGDLKIVELNTCCPAGFLHSEAFCEATQHALAALLPDEGFARLRPGAIDPGALVQGLLAIEQSAGLQPEMMAALTDENQILHELDLLLASLRKANSRQIEIIDARELEYRGGRLLHHGRPISLTYNKFRISVPGSRNHCWREGFEDRYAAYLHAVQDGAVASVNNFFGMAVGEDKGLLSLWSDPELEEQFTAAEREFVAQHVAWTRPLAPSEVEWRGRTIRLPDFVCENREQFVIKPAGEGRGFGVVIGKYATDEAWRAACTPDPCMPSVVQEFIPPLQLPVVACRNGNVAAEMMFLTVGLATVCGQYRGVLSRVSPNPVTNVAQSGMVQAVLAKT